MVHNDLYLLNNIDKCFHLLINNGNFVLWSTSSNKILCLGFSLCHCLEFYALLFFPVCIQSLLLSWTGLTFSCFSVFNYVSREIYFSLCLHSQELLLCSSVFMMCLKIFCIDSLVVGVTYLYFFVHQ